MKKTIIILIIASVLIAGTVLTGFPTQTQKEQIAERGVLKAEQKLNSAQNKVIKQLQKTKTEKKLKVENLELKLTILDNKVRIAHLNSKITTPNTLLNEEYADKIYKLEMENTMLSKLVVNKDESRNKWLKLEQEFRKDMDTFGEMCKKLAFGEQDK